jgi:hypothetical protein
MTNEKKHHIMTIDLATQNKANNLQKQQTPVDCRSDMTGSGVWRIGKEHCGGKG